MPSLRVLFAPALFLHLCLAALPAHAQTILVFAAASLKGPLDTAAERFSASDGASVKISYAASSALAKQIEQGAPADLFASADEDWMDYLSQRGLIRTQTRADLLGNTLVVVTAKSSPLTALELNKTAVLAALGDGRLAITDPKSAPAGKYTKAAFESLGFWNDVAPRIAGTETVRVALALVARGEAPLGVVYASDAAAEPGVRTLAVFPDASHPAIIYPFAVTASGGPAAERFLAFLKTPPAAEIFRAAGFRALQGKGP